MPLFLTKPTSTTATTTPSHSRLIFGGLRHHVGRLHRRPQHLRRRGFIPLKRKPVVTPTEVKSPPQHRRRRGKSAVTAAKSRGHVSLPRRQGKRRRTTKKKRTQSATAGPSLTSSLGKTMKRTALKQGKALVRQAVNALSGESSSTRLPTNSAAVIQRALKQTGTKIAQRLTPQRGSLKRQLEEEEGNYDSMPSKRRRHTMPASMLSYRNKPIVRGGTKQTGGRFLF